MRTASVPWNEHGLAESPDTLTLTTKPLKIRTLVLQAAKGSNDAWFHGLTTDSGHYFPGAMDLAYPTAAHAFHAAWQDALSELTPAHGHEPAFRKFLTSCEESLHRVHPIPFVAGTPTAPSSSPATIDPPPSTSSTESPRFQLYEITSVPAGSVPPESAFYPESNRLALEYPPPGITLLHLLSAVTDYGIAYGYRVNDLVHLPDITDMETLDQMPDVALPIILGRALSLVGSGEDPSHLPIEAALWDASCRYFPEIGEAEIPFFLEYAAPQEAPAITTPGGYQAILAAPSTDRTGSSGPGSGGYVAPDKALKNIEAMLEKLDGNSAVIADRLHTAEILLRVLRNESSTTALKDHLLGK